LSGAGRGFFGFVFFTVFFAGFFADFLAAFFATGAFFLAAEVFLTVFLAFLAPRFTVFARFFGADALAELRDVRVFFAPRFLTVFFLAFATTNSFYRSNKIVGGTTTSTAP
jgi:hypothetical protein